MSVLQGLGIQLPIPTSSTASASGSVLANVTNATYSTAGSDILSSSITISGYGRVAILFTASASGVLSAVINGVSATLNDGNSLTAGAWYEFQMLVGNGMTLNFTYSVTGTITLIVIFVSC